MFLIFFFFYLYIYLFIYFFWQLISHIIVFYAVGVERLDRKSGRLRQNCRRGWIQIIKTCSLHGYGKLLTALLGNFYGKSRATFTVEHNECSRQNTALWRQNSRLDTANPLGPFNGKSGQHLRFDTANPHGNFYGKSRQHLRLDTANLHGSFHGKSQHHLRLYTANLHGNTLGFIRQ